jgi:LAO/AO transport system kinase
MLHLRPPSAWQIPVLLTQAATGVGIEAVRAALARHHDFVAADAGRTQRDARRREDELLDILCEELRRRLATGLDDGPDGVASLLAAVRDGAIDPYSAALRVLENSALLAELIGRGRS